jgi:hypothetical protein
MVGTLREDMLAPRALHEAAAIVSLIVVDALGPCLGCSGPVDPSRFPQDAFALALPTHDAGTDFTHERRKVFCSKD